MITGWWFGTFFIFPYIGNNHPNWLIFFRGVQTTNQIMMIIHWISGRWMFIPTASACTSWSLGGFLTILPAWVSQRTVVETSHGGSRGFGMQMVRSFFWAAASRMKPMLVGGLEHFWYFLFSHILGISSSQLTNIFQRGGPTTNQNGVDAQVFSSWKLLETHMPCSSTMLPLMSFLPGS